MAIKHTLSLIANNGGTDVQATVAQSDGVENNVSTTGIASDTDILVAFALDFSQLKSFYLLSNTTLLIETNNSGAPDDTITTTANVPVLWYTGCAHPNLFTVDVTALYVTETSAVNWTLEIQCLADPTP